MAMISAQYCIFTFTALFICSGLGFINGEFGGGFGRKLEDLQTIIVDKGSKLGPRTIQAAIDSVPSNNQNWIFIQVKAGVYTEQVKITLDKQFIYLKGEEIGKTIVEWDTPYLVSPAFEFMADNIVVSGITFVDTLYDHMGRHYFENCSIEGATDFIFGLAQSIYQNCTISVNIESLKPGVKGYVTANGRNDPNSSSGFVFKQCSVDGNGKALLGRAWMAYSRVIFYDSYFSDAVASKGWSAWNQVGHESNLTYVEEQCRGPGSNKSNRVGWEKTLNPEELQIFTSISYIDSGGWISKLPQN